MPDEYEVTFNCAYDGATHKGFKIYIDDRELPNTERGLLSPFAVKERIECGKHKLAVIGNNAAASKFWWISVIIESVLMFVFGMPDDEKSTGPYFAAAEGELTVDGDAEVSVRLKDSDIYKLKKDMIRDCRFHIVAIRNCAWTESGNYVTTTPKYKRRWLIAAITPFSIISGFLIWIFSALGMDAFSRGEVIWGLFCMVFVVALLTGFIFMLKSIIKVVSKKPEAQQKIH